MESFLVDSISVDGDEVRLDLDYFRVEQYISSKRMAYGVRIDMKKVSEDGLEDFETKTIYNVFCVKDLIDEFITKLVKCSVTPTSLEDITRDYIQDMIYAE